MRVKIHHEGANILVVLLLVVLAINVPLWLWVRPLIWPIVSTTVFGVLYMLVVNFFRSPRRVYTGNPNRAVVSSADGKVVALEEVYEPEVLKCRCLQLSVFIGLIITNCILMGRLEAFAMANRPWPSFLDGVGNGIGYTIILVIVAFFRELLGCGTLLGFQVVPDCCYEAGYVNNGLMILPPMALIVVACIIWVHRSYNKDLQEN